MSAPSKKKGLVPDRPDALADRHLDFEQILEDLMRDPQVDGIQVHNGDGGEQLITDFGGDTANQIREVITYIEANKLYDEKPWSIIWNLWQLLNTALYGPPEIEIQDPEPEIPAIDFGED